MIIVIIIMASMSDAFVDIFSFFVATSMNISKTLSTTWRWDQVSSFYVLYHYASLIAMSSGICSLLGTFCGPFGSSSLLH